MRISNLLGFAVDALVGHRLRTSLTILGLAVGIAAVIVLTALGEGARRFVVGEFEGLGNNLLIVIPGKVETTGMIPFGGVVHDLTLDDVGVLRARLRDARRVVPVSVGTETVRWRSRSRSAAVLGTTADFLALRRLEMARGRFLADGDLESGASEVVLGSTVAEELFGGAGAIGEPVRIGAWRFRVVGVLAPKGRTMAAFDMDDLVVVPVQTGMSMFNRSSLFRVLVEVRSHSLMGSTRRQLIDVLAARHRAEDVTVISQDAVISAFSSILGSMTLALAGIASISLLVAGVGIMNVMLVSVTERRPEIGLLKALGATDRQILLAFMAEAMLLAMAGGAVGVFGGFLAARLSESFVPSLSVIPPGWAVASALAMAYAVGSVFGVLPARRATRLDPVRALSGR